MQLEHSFNVPVGIDDAWKILLDIERIGPCMPGATIESVDGDDFTGSVKVKLGPINLTYKGKASFVEKDAAAHKAVIDARGRDARGNGTASAKVTATLVDASGETTVKVLTDLDITGKPAQFGRGVMADVGNKLIGQFADCLATTIGGSGDASPPAEAAPAANKLAVEKPVAKASPRPKPAPAGAEAAAASAVAATDAPISGSAPQAAEESAPVVQDAPAAAGSPAADPSAPSFAAPASAPATSEPDEEPSVNGHVTSAPRAPAREVEPIDLFASAGPAVAKRLIPVIAPVAVAAVVVLIARRRRGKR